MSKYKVGQKFKDCRDLEDLIYTILAVSPDVDCEGEYAYFVELLKNSKYKWYDIAYDDEMEKLEMVD